MAHEWETGYAVGQRTWHGLENLIATYPETWREAQHLAGAEWKVTEHPAFYRPIDLSGLELDPVVIPDKKVLLRTSGSPRYLATVGQDYSVYQNEDFFRWWTPFLAEKNVGLEVAGVLRQGRVIFACGRVLGDAANVVPGDEIRPYLVRTSGHDGLHAKSTLFTTVRVVCMNTLRAATSEADKGGQILREIHRGDHLARDTYSQEVADLARRSFAISVEQYRAMARKGFSDLELKHFIVQSLSRTWDEKDVRESLGRPGEDVLRTHELGYGADVHAARGTVWSAYNAVTEWVDHHRGQEHARVTSSFEGQGAAIKDRAFELALAAIS